MEKSWSTSDSRESCFPAIAIIIVVVAVAAYFMMLKGGKKESKNMTMAKPVRSDDHQSN